MQIYRTSTIQSPLKAFLFHDKETALPLKRPQDALGLIAGNQKHPAGTDILSRRDTAAHVMTSGQKGGTFRFKRRYFSGRKIVLFPPYKGWEMIICPKMATYSYTPLHTRHGVRAKKTGNSSPLNAARQDGGKACLQTDSIHLSR